MLFKNKKKKKKRKTEEAGKHTPTQTAAAFSFSFSCTISLDLATKQNIYWQHTLMHTYKHMNSKRADVWCFCKYVVQ